MKSLCGILSALLLVLLVSSCSSVRHVPQGKYLLDKVKISVEDSAKIDTRELHNFLRQTPNHKALGFTKLQLATYNLSGQDTTKWYNRWLRRAGEAPVVYDSAMTAASCRQIQLALVNRGYLSAKVDADIRHSGKRRIAVDYIIHAGKPHRIGRLDYSIPDPHLEYLVVADTVRSLIKNGMLLDRNVLEAERVRITRRLREAGYYRFNRELINFTADTIAGDRNVALTVNLRSPAYHETEWVSPTDTFGLTLADHHRYDIRSVSFVLADASTPREQLDTLQYGGISYIYGKDKYLQPKVLDEMCYIIPGTSYNPQSIERTYEALGRLSIIRHINIEMVPSGAVGQTGLLDAVINLSRNKKQSMTAELEGTNSEGDLGFGIGLTYRHRNIGRGSELLTAKLRSSYESLSGNLEGLINKRYTEFAGELGITFPKFEFPFLSKSFKQRRLATTEFALTANYQERPEYTRVIMGAGWKWKWQQMREDKLRRQIFDLVDVNYVRLPSSTINFIDQIAPTNPLLRYSYEDHFIMRTGYSYSRTNRRLPSGEISARALQPYVESIRLSGETAGNLLYGISNLIGQKRSDGVYKVLGIQYAQYIKADLDYTYTRNFTRRSALAAHVGMGAVYPYGNSTMVPFEKRFYAGGANSVRGWSVRTLGPGSYDAKNSVTDFINQCGDIRLDLSLEYRAKLFWVLEGALFVDAGNIWTVHNYENQPGGLFKFDSFYRQIAAAYGAGLRLDFTVFLLRFDLGLKAHNPAMNQERWPIVHPNWRRDANFHFSVGYPF